VRITYGNTVVSLVKGDITLQDTEAIVNAANSTLMGGGGVDGAIHRAGGPQILEECKKIKEKIGSLPTGQAVITSGGNLKARYVIHTVGPIWRGGNGNEDELLAQAYVNSLKLAVEHGVKTIAFPSISTGVYRFPTERASMIACQAISQFLQMHNRLDEVRLVLFSDKDYTIYKNAFEEIYSS